MLSFTASLNVLCGKEPSRYYVVEHGCKTSALVFDAFPTRQLRALVRSVTVNSSTMNDKSNFGYLIDRVTPHIATAERTRVFDAYEVARQAHADQTRDEGTPYIVHPVRVAVSVVDELNIYSPTLICSALLHDVIEDSDITREDIARMFGEEIAEVVWLLTKLDEVKLSEYLARIETASHTGAPLVKLCDRLDNLRSVVHTPRIEKIYRYIRTTEDLYLPLAARTNQYLHDELLRCLDAARKHVETLPADSYS